MGVGAWRDGSVSVTRHSLLADHSELQVDLLQKCLTPVALSQNASLARPCRVTMKNVTLGRFTLERFTPRHRRFSNSCAQAAISTVRLGPHA